MSNAQQDAILQSMSKAELIDLVYLYSQFLLTVDGLWFLSAEKSLGLEEAIRWDEDVWREFGKLSAKRLQKALSIKSVGEIEDLGKLSLLSPMFICLGGHVEIEEGMCRLSITECRPQQARVRKALGEFPCKSVGIAYFEGFSAALDPRLKFRCVHCPPDEHPEDLFCQWELWVDRRS